MIPDRTALRHCLAVLAMLALAGCAAQPQAPAAGLEHIIVVWLKEPGNAQQRARILAESEILRTIPGVTALKSGTVVPGERAIVDSSFDVALIVSFPDRAAMDAYLKHPVHVQLVEETLQPLVSRIQVYDFM